MNYPKAFDAMLAAWNKPDPTLVRAHLDSALSADVHFVDPTIDLRGIGAFESMVHEVKARIPGAVYSRASLLDCHHNLYPYHWLIHLKGELLIQGFDVLEASDEGLVERVLGFFGELRLAKD